MIRLGLKFTPVKILLFPGHPLAELAWSELRYDPMVSSCPIGGLDHNCSSAAQPLTHIGGS